MAYLNREQIVNSTTLTSADVDVPEWGGVVRVRELSAKEYDEYQQSMIMMNGKSPKIKLSNATAKIVALGCIDEQGQRLFTREDVEVLGKLSAAALARVAEKIQQLSGIMESDVKALTVNFTSDPLNDSTSS